MFGANGSKKKRKGKAMMCEHDFVQEEWIVEVCNKCDKLRVRIDIEEQLAAANARIAELEKQCYMRCWKM